MLNKFIAKLAITAIFIFIFSSALKAQETNSVRIAVMQNADNVSFKTNSNTITVSDAKNKKYKITKDNSFTLKTEKGIVNMSGNMLVPPITFTVISKKGRLEINGKQFIGDIAVNLSEQKKLDIIEILPVEKYLLGVVGKEMPPEWPVEALKAQAIASRSFAYANLKPDQPYDMTADVRSQVYSGMENPSENVIQAVEGTKDMVLKDGENVLIAYFHSHCGGMTETPDHVWENYRTKKIPVPEPLKKPIRDLYCSKTVPKEHKSWSISISAKTMLNIAKKKNTKAKQLTKIVKGKTDASGRTVSLTAYSNAKTISIDIQALRNAIGPTKFKSSFITGIIKTKTGWTIKGKGYGHGVGMCQWGAKAMADSNKNYRQILGYYYPGAKIEKY